jgi:hypothetical protein
MRAASLVALAGAALVTASQRIAQVYYQPITAAEATPLPLADVTFDPFSPSTASVSSYEAPDLLTAFEEHPAGEEQLVRIGLWDPKRGAWISSVGVASAATFTEKGISPHITLHVDEAGRVLGAGARGVGIDAGQTRDFGPQAVITVARDGKGVEVGKPVVLGVDGRKKVEEPPKSLLQK